MSKVDDVVGQIKKDYEAGGWDSVGFQDDQAKNSLDKLAGLNSTEFKEAFDRLRDVKSSESYEYTLFEQLLKDAGDLKDKPEYKDLVKALESGNPDDYLKVKKTKEDDAAKVEYEEYGFEKFKNEKKHAQYVDLYQPKGASEALKLLIKDTEFTMQWDFDTLGLGNPKAAPDFTQVLDGEQVTSADGWSGVRTAHKDLKEQLEKRQNTYTDDHKDVTSTTYDSKITGSDTFKALVRIMNDLNDDLKYEPSGLTRTGNQLTEGSGGPPTSDMQIPVYEKNTDQNGDGHDKWFLTAEAEQRYYVRAIDDAVEEWDKVYGDATKKYQQQAEDVDNKNARDHNNNNANNNNANSNNNNANNSVGNNSPYVPPPATNTSTQQTGTSNEDWGSTYDDLLGGSTDTTGTGTQPISDTGTVDTSTTSGYPATGGSSSPYGGTGTGTGSGTGTTSGQPISTAAAPASSDNSMADTMRQIAMTSALSGIMNPQNRQPDDAQAYEQRDRDRQDEWDRRRERERNRNAQTATANQPVQQGAPGVTAPTYAGTPPPVTALGATPTVQIGDTKVQASPPVAEALQKQTQNTALDAVSAYKGTAGEITAEHPPSVVNGPAELKTGDILQWERHSALIVRNENGLFIVDDGRLVPLEPNNPPLVEKYGNFAGFIHPTGLDVGSNTADPGATAPPQPKVSSAPPAGPPPVGPPPQV